MKGARRVLGSFCSVVFGWIVCVSLWTVGVFAASAWGQPISHAMSNALGFGFYVAAICGACTLGVWAFIFVWIYCLTPRSSRLWGWRECTFGCGLAGVAFVIAALAVAGQGGGMVAYLIFGPSACVTGAASGFFASFTAPYFHRL